MEKMLRLITLMLVLSVHASHAGGFKQRTFTIGDTVYSLVSEDEQPRLLIVNAKAKREVGLFYGKGEQVVLINNHRLSQDMVIAFIGGGKLISVFVESKDGLKLAPRSITETLSKSLKSR